METSCSRVGVGPYFSGRDTETILRIPRSRWDTRESLYDRLLLETEDDPRSAKLSNGSSLENMTLYSIQYMLEARPSMTPSNLFRDIRAAAADMGPLWSSEDILWSWCAYRGVDSVTLDDLKGLDMEGISIQPGQSIHDWFSVQKKGAWKCRAQRSEHLPMLDVLVKDSTEEWTTQDPLPRGMMDPRFSLVYRITDSTFTVPSLEDLFFRFRVASWAPQGPKDMCMAICIAQDPAMSRVQVVPSGLPFPWRESYLLPFVSVGENTSRFEWLRAPEPRVYTYHSSLGWASLEKTGVEEFRIEILQKPTLSLRDTDLLNQWASFMDLRSLERFQTLEDRGAYISLAFRDIPTTSFSWFALYDLLVSDPLLLHFFQIVQKPVPVTEDPPGSSIEIILQPGVVHVLGLQDIHESLKINLSVFIHNEEESSLEIHIHPRFPIHHAQSTTLAELFRAVLLYTSHHKDRVLDGFRSMGVLKTVERLETKFLQSPGLDAPPWMDLTLLFPRIFIPHYYKSLCQAQLQPLLLTEEQADNIDEEETKMQFPNKPLTDPFGMIVEPQWYACPSPIWKYPGLKRNDHEDAILPVVPCCFKTPQGNKVKDKMMKMDLGVDMVSTKRKDNIIKKNKIIRHPGQIGIVLPLFPGLGTFFTWNYPEADLYRIGVQNSPWSFMECLQYVALRGQSMPPQEYYPHRLINLIQEHHGLFQSCIPFRTVDNMIQAIREPGREFWIDPRIFLPFLEAMYKVQIYVWAVEEDGEVHMIRSQTPRMYPRSVYILMHYGGRMNLLIHKPYPQCELLAWRPLLPYVESVSATGLHVEFETRSFPLLRVPDPEWRRAILTPPLWNSQTLLPTGNILGLELSTAGVMVWLPVDSGIPSMDLPMTSRNSWTLSQDPVVILRGLVGVEEALGTINIKIEWETSAVEVSYHGTRFLLWKFRFMDSPWWMVLSKVMDTSSVNTIFQRLLKTSSSTDTVRILRRSSPPLGFLPALQLFSKSTASTIKPTLHPYQFSAQGRFVRLLRNVVLHFFRIFSRTADPTVTWEEKVRVFLSRYTTVRPEHYNHLDLSLFVAVDDPHLKKAVELCTVPGSDPDQPIVCLPSARMVSRLHYMLVWKLLHNSLHSETEDPAGEGWISKVDRRTMVYSFQGMVDLFTENKKVHTYTFSMDNLEEPRRPTILTVRTGTLKEMSIPPECLRGFPSIFSPPEFRCAEVPSIGVQHYVEEVCPEWTEWRSTMNTSISSNVVLIDPSVTGLTNALVWDTTKGAFSPDSPTVTRPVFLIPPLDPGHGPQHWRVLLHPLFFDQQVG